jgi:hypothetical protein
MSYCNDAEFCIIKYNDGLGGVTVCGIKVLVMKVVE